MNYLTLPAPVADVLTKLFSTATSRRLQSLVIIAALIGGAILVAWNEIQTPILDHINSLPTEDQAVPLAIFAAVQGLMLTITSVLGILYLFVPTQNSVNQRSPALNDWRLPAYVASTTDGVLPVMTATVSGDGFGNYIARLNDTPEVADAKG